MSSASPTSPRLVVTRQEGDGYTYNRFCCYIRFDNDNDNNTNDDKK
jgi:hypothetical protein